MRPALDAFAASVPFDGLKIATSTDPAASVEARPGGFRVAIVDDTPGDGTFLDAYSLEAPANGHYRVHCGGILGAQYGLAQLLEDAGFRFFHPESTVVPKVVTAPDETKNLGKLFTPERALRGLRPHTIHPIEAYWAFWEPSDDSLARAKRIVDWTVKNRGNYLEWVALNDILSSTDRAGVWKTHTKQIVDYAHARGVRVGIGIQLFQASSLQNGFTLLTKYGGDGDVDTMVDELAKLNDAGPFDIVDLSFGEFSGTDPMVFVDSLNNVTKALTIAAPTSKLVATVHVGNYPKLFVDYMGEHQLYYFLVRYAQPPVEAWVHTVMYYDLFEDAGGAYKHDDFSMHRDFILSELKKGKDVGYFPETAYWVAFDDSVPTYLPLYVRSRWLDLGSLDQAADAQGSSRLKEHVIFSSGWEWGYWQNDYAALRMSFQRPATWGEAYEQMFAPWGDAGRALAQKVVALGELQHDGLIGKRLAAYLAARDDLIDIGAKSGTVSQPARPSLADVVAMSAADRAAFASNVLDPLDALAQGTEQIGKDVAALGLSNDDPWVSEIVDGIEVDAARTAFALATYRAAVSLGDGGGDGGWAAKADAALERGRTVVMRRHAHLHDPSPERLLARGKNATLYQYGYLNEADTLCYWVRERAALKNAQQATSDVLPPCVL